MTWDRVCAHESGHAVVACVVPGASVTGVWAHGLRGECPYDPGELACRDSDIVVRLGGLAGEALAGYVDPSAAFQCFMEEPRMAGDASWLTREEWRLAWPWAWGAAWWCVNRYRLAVAVIARALGVSRELTGDEVRQLLEQLPADERPPNASLCASNDRDVIGLRFAERLRWLGKWPAEGRELVAYDDSGRALIIARVEVCARSFAFVWARRPGEHALDLWRVSGMVVPWGEAPVMRMERDLGRFGPSFRVARLEARGGPPQRPGTHRFAWPQGGGLVRAPGRHPVELAAGRQVEIGPRNKALWRAAREVARVEGAPVRLEG